MDDHISFTTIESHNISYYLQFFKLFDPFMFSDIYVLINYCFKLFPHNNDKANQSISSAHHFLKILYGKYSAVTHEQL